MALLFFDLSLLPSSNPNSRLLAAARAFEQGYAAVALDHPHRGLLADADRCRTAPFPVLSSLPLPSSASLHRSRNGSPNDEPFRQYTRITLSLDSIAAAASALAPSAARLLRTYDIVAVRPLNQATLDYLCQFATEMDVISIDFSHKLPFRLKLAMIKLALQRGIHFEIAYSPLIDDVNSRRQVLAEAKVTNVVLPSVFLHIGCKHCLIISFVISLPPCSAAFHNIPACNLLLQHIACVLFGLTSSSHLHYAQTSGS
uniref:Uncharacterized protein n=1 Tax=Avena sativa TaxID=4498 RepID=A0ACD5YWR3_AVESA